MKKASGIVSVSFPFTAGVAAAALIGRPFGTAIACSAAALTALAATALSHSKAPILLLFAALGAFCWSTAALSPPLLSANYLTGAADALAQAINDAGFPGEHSAAIVTALLTGRRGGLEKETVTAFRQSGASHILALSGLHLGVIYLFLRRLLTPLGNSQPARIAKSAVTVSLCGLYALATGAGPSIVRAFLFIATGELCRATSSRRPSPAGTFSIALTLQLTANPLLISSAGFQMSYLAMLGITTLYPHLKNWYPAGNGPDPLRRIWNASALSFSCQLFTAPAAWWHFRSLPKYFLLSNLIGLPLAEAVIVTAVTCLILNATGFCPHLLVKACGKMVCLLEFCLKTIAEM